MCIRVIRLPMIGLVVSLAACSSGGQPQELNANQRAEYVAVLAEMMEADQRHRGALSWGTTDQDEIVRLNKMDIEEGMAELSRRRKAGIELPEEVRAELSEKQTALDHANTARLMEYVERYGWPNEDRIGLHANPTAILIHMPMDAVEGILPILKREVLAGRMEARQYAPIFDRKRQHAGQIQLYGVSRAFDPATGTVRPPVIADIEETNAARAEIGLPPLEEYTIAN